MEFLIGFGKIIITWITGLTGMVSNVFGIPVLIAFVIVIIALGATKNR